MSSFVISPSVSPIQLLLNSIITQYLLKTNCLTVVSEIPFDFNFPIPYTYLIPDNYNQTVYQLLDVSEKGCSDYIIQMKEPQIFMTALEKVTHLGKIRRSDRKVIFLPHPDADNHTNIALDLFSMKESSFIRNILFIVPEDPKESNCESFHLITHKFVGPDAGAHEPLYLDQWNSCTRKFDKNADLFPHNMVNLHGKTLKVACFTYKPYVLLDTDIATEPLGRTGIEIKLVDEFCKWINCTVEIIREDKDQWGTIYDNQTGDGVLGSVYEDRADMGITALYSWFEVFKVMDFSAPFLRTAITCIAPAPRVLVSWEMPLMPFSLNMWLAVFITFIFAATGLIVARKCSTDRVLLTVFGIMISQSQRSADSSWRIRSVTGWLLIAGLILVSAYGGGLASTFTVPKYEQSIDTIQDIVNKKIVWAATHDAWIFSIIMSPQPLMKQLVSQFRTYSFEELEEKSHSRDMAFSLEKLPAGYFAIGDYIKKKALLNFTIMLEDFYYEQCVVTMRKSSPYTKKISQLVGRLHQSGLLLAWETQVALKHLNYKVQLEIKLSRSRSKNDVSIKPLSLRHVVGVFIFFASGVTVSLIVFLGEIVMAVLIQKNRAH